jgi:hypothetical protein
MVDAGIHHHTQESRTRTRPVPSPRSSGDGGLATLVYRSRATEALGWDELDALLRRARERNRREGLTGLLVYDRGHFFQWLEGPAAALERVWEAVRRDPRHRDIERLGSPRLPMRLFADWEMRLAVRSPQAEAAGEDVLSADPELLRRLAGGELGGSEILAALASFSSTACADLACSGLASSHHQSVRRLCETVVRGLAGRQTAPRTPRPRVRAPVDEAGLEGFLDALLDRDDRAARGTVDSLRRAGFGCATLGAGLFEPAARRLGDRWQDDACSLAGLALGTSRLATLLRSVLDAAPTGCGPCPPSVLVARVPGETDVLAPSLAATQLLPAGCALDCDFPEDADALARAIGAAPRAVLVLTLDPVRGTLRAGHAALTALVARARAASTNPALAVLLCGRPVSEDPGLARRVGADAGVDHLADLADAVRAAALCAGEAVEH